MFTRIPVLERLFFIISTFHFRLLNYFSLLFLFFSITARHLGKFFRFHMDLYIKNDPFLNNSAINITSKELNIKIRKDVTQKRSSILLPLSISAASADATVSGVLPDLILKYMCFVSRCSAS